MNKRQMKMKLETTQKIRHVALGSVVVFLATFYAAAISTAQPSNGGQKVLRWVEAWPVQLDPAMSSDTASTVIALNVYDTLIFPRVDGTFTSHLAKSWVVSGNGLTYTFTLRDDARFHNGDPVTAADVAYSLERTIAIGQNNGSLFEKVSAVQVRDSKTVEITLREPFGPFLPSLIRLYVLNKNEVVAHTVTPGDYGPNGDYGTAWLASRSAGGGPYMVTDYNAQEFVVMRKFDSWWGGWDEGAPDVFRMVPSMDGATLISKMRDRAVDVTDEWMPTAIYEQLDALEGVSVALLPEQTNLNIMLNTQRAPTDDVHFRRALAYAMPYQETLQVAFLGSTKATGPVPMATPGYSANGTIYTTDLTKAREELNLSPYRNQLDQYRVTLHWVAEVPEEENIGLLLQRNAAMIGINVDVVGKPWSEVAASVRQVSTTAHATIIIYPPSYPDAGSMLDRYHSSRNGIDYRQMEWLREPSIDAAIQDALATVDESARMQKYANLQAALRDLSPTIWLGDYVSKRAYQDYIYFPAAERAKAGLPTVTEQVGYVGWAHDMKFLPQQDEIPSPAGCGCSSAQSTTQGGFEIAMAFAVLALVGSRRRRKGLS